MLKETPCNPILPLTSYIEYPKETEIWMPHQNDGKHPLRRSGRNGDPILHNVYDAIRNDKRCVKQFDNEVCAFCRSSLTFERAFKYAWQGDSPLIHNANCRNAAEVFACKNCGWWYMRHDESATGYNEHFAINRLFEGAIYCFDWQETHPAIAQLRRQIRDREIDLADISPLELEKLVGSVFRDHFQCKVTHIGGPGDEGIDLLLVYDGVVRTIVQVKRRLKQDGVESPTVVRDLVGTMVHSGVNHGLLATSSAGVSEGTERWIRGFPEQYSHLKVDIYNQHKLLELLELTTPKAPWKGLAKTLESQIPPSVRQR